MAAVIFSEVPPHNSAARAPDEGEWAVLYSEVYQDPMTKYLRAEDFRAYRRVLEPEDFAIGGDDCAPTDLIDEYTWGDLTTLAMDVSIRTSDHNGTILRELYELWAVWLTMIGNSGNPLATTMLDAGDEFRAATFAALLGFYRQSIGCARNALELVAIGSACHACNLDHEFDLWRKAEKQMGFGSACDRLSNFERTQPLRANLMATMDDSLFDPRTKDHAEGWIRRLYGEFSNYAHSRPEFGNGDLWESNGPVYVTNAFRLCNRIQRATYGACYIMAKIARPDLRLPPLATVLLFTSGRDGSWRPPKIAVKAGEQLGLLP